MTLTGPETVALISFAVIGVGSIVLAVVFVFAVAASLRGDRRRAGRYRSDALDAELSEMTRGLRVVTPAHLPPRKNAAAALRTPGRTTHRRRVDEHRGF